jgi:hypothetical protein
MKDGRKDVKEGRKKGKGCQGMEEGRKEVRK